MLNNKYLIINILFNASALFSKYNEFFARSQVLYSLPLQFSAFSVFEILTFSLNLYREYTSLKSRELEELPRFGVMSWQPF